MILSASSVKVDRLILSRRAGVRVVPVRVCGSWNKWRFISDVGDCRWLGFVPDSFNNATLGSFKVVLFQEKKV